MSDSNELRNLILHAATLLEVQRDRTSRDNFTDKAVVAALSHGNAVLRMVAACMATEDNAVAVARREVRKEAATAPRDKHGRFVKGGA